MTNTLEEITREALALSRQQRLALAGFLLEMDDATTDPEAEVVWDEEIRARKKAIEDGTAVGIPYEDVMREAEKRLAP